mgnify:CR=1 FL=1
MTALPEAVRRRLPGWRGDTPSAFGVDGRRAGVRTVVACVGDSITLGQVSSNYVNRLKQRWEPRGFQFINAGVNGDLAYNVASRLDAVIACQPDVVTMLVGGNDVNAQFDDTWRARYRKDQRLPVDPTIERYAEHVELILRRLRAETDATVVVLEIAPLGEDLTSRMNGLVDRYNVALRELAARHDVRCLPLHDRLVELLPAGHTPPPYNGDVRAIMKAAASHLLLRRSWDSISTRNGLALLTDYIHFNDRAAGVVADLISSVLQEHQP